MNKYLGGGSGLIMIKQFGCSNFRNVKVDNLNFGKINILIGPNNAGKSNFIRAISFCANMMNLSNDISGFWAEVQRNGTAEIICRDQNASRVDLRWKIALFDQDVNYSLSFKTGQTIQDFLILNESVDAAETISGHDHPFNYFRCHDQRPGMGMFSTAYQFGEKNSRVHVPVQQNESVLLQFDKLVIQNRQLGTDYVRNTMFKMLEEMRSYFSHFYSYSSSKFDFALIRQLCDPQTDGRVLKKDGSNFLNVYQYAMSIDPNFYTRLFLKMKELITDLTEIRIAEGLDKIGLRFFIGDTGYWLSEVSDGTVEALLLALMTSLPKEQSLSLLAIDEPEVNLHPAWQSVLAKWIQTSGNFTQCFISTHSSDFLDSFTEGFRDGTVNIFVHDPIGPNSFKALKRERVNQELEKGWLLGDLYRVNDPAIGGWPW